MTEQDAGLSYSHRVCRRCGADLERIGRAWRGDVWRCPNAGAGHGHRSADG